MTPLTTPHQPQGGKIVGGVAAGASSPNNQNPKPHHNRGGLKSSSKSISWRDSTDASTWALEQENNTKGAIKHTWNVTPYIPAAAAAGAAGTGVAATSTAKPSTGEPLDRSLHTIPASPLANCTQRGAALGADGALEGGPAAEGDVPFAGFPTMAEPPAARPLPKTPQTPQNAQAFKAQKQHTTHTSVQPDTPSPPTVPPPRTRLRNTILDSCDSGEYDVLVPGQVPGQAGVQDAEGMWLRSPLELGSAMHASEVRRLNGE